jgi:hypothetical protein
LVWLTRTRFPPSLPEMAVLATTTATAVEAAGPPVVVVVVVDDKEAVDNAYATLTAAFPSTVQMFASAGLPLAEEEKRDFFPHAGLQPANVVWDSSRDIRGGAHSYVMQRASMRSCDFPSL